MVHILRFKFSDNIVTLINNFSIKNKSLERKEYKKEWNHFMEFNDRVINEEIERIKNLGYNECVKDKMFKAGRYYFRKKYTDTGMPEANSVMPSHVTVPKKRAYIKISSNLLNSMDTHIQKNINNKSYTPANGHKMYCLNHMELLRKEKKEIGMDSIDMFLGKIKKTYKNRYFLISQKMDKANAKDKANANANAKAKANVKM